MLAHLFPHRKRSVLELILRRCDLDLLKAIEQCRPTPSAFKPIAVQVLIAKHIRFTTQMCWQMRKHKYIVVILFFFRFECVAKSTKSINFIGAKVHHHSNGNGRGNSSNSHNTFIALCTDACRLSEMGVSNVNTIFNGSDGSTSFGQFSIQMYFHQLSNVRVPNWKILEIWIRSSPSSYRRYLPFMCRYSRTRWSSYLQLQY